MTELPTTAGLWRREGVPWLVHRDFKLFNDRPPEPTLCLKSIDKAGRLVDHSIDSPYCPRGNWFPAVPAQPAALAFLKQHTDQPAATELDPAAQAEDWPEVDKREAKASARCRTAAQYLIEKIGAPGPESVVETAARAAQRITDLENDLHEAREQRNKLLAELSEARAELKRPKAEASQP